mgnify:CR=1 FL=1
MNGTLRPAFDLAGTLDTISGFMYTYVLVALLIGVGLYFFIRTRALPLRLFKEAIRVVTEPPQEEGEVSSFRALMVSTASRVGVGNIAGVATAVATGGPGAVFWMWVLAILGSATAFIESTLAQIYKRKDNADNCYGGPAYYIETALKSKFLAMLFVLFLICTYGFGFNLLCSYNLQSTFAVYSFYHPQTTPIIIGAIVALLTLFCLLGGGKGIVRITEILVPVMGISYVVVSAIVLVVNARAIPGMFALIFSDAFSPRSFAGGLAGSCLIYGIKRGLYSNEAGVGSAPNAAASAMVSHPVKQGLVQVVSVFIDTMLICTSTALMCLSTGVARTKDIQGAPYVQEAIRSVLGSFGPTFIAFAMTLFAFTTLLGNLYYCENALAYLNHNKRPSKPFMTCFHILCSLIIFVGAISASDVAWALADITMGLMALINIPCCIRMGGLVIRTAKDYELQKKAGKNPVFFAKNIGMKEEEIQELDYWKE